MYKPDEKNIDRVSRDAAERYQPPGEPSWDALQQRLDKELPQEKEKKRRGFFFFFLLLLGLSVAGTGIWYGLKINTANKTILLSGKNNTEEKWATATEAGGTNAHTQPQSDAVVATEQKNNETAPATTAAANSTDGKNKTITGSALPVYDDKITGGNTSDLVNISAPKNTPAGKSINKPANSSTSNLNGSKLLKDKTAGDAHKAVKGSHKQAPVYGGATSRRDDGSLAGTPIPQTQGNKTKNNRKRSKLVPKDITPALALSDENDASIAATNTGTDNIKDVASNGSNSNNESSANILADTATAGKVTAITPAAPDSAIAKTLTKDSIAEVAKKKKSKTKNEKAINIGLTAGLDLSTVKFTHGDNVGYNLGLMGGYQFSKHWSVYTGVVYTKKNYELDGKDYHPPKHYWTQYVNLQTVEGYCRMWEIPVQARYTFNPGAKTAFFASTGLSSYFMKKQNYNYSYKNNMGVQGYAQWNNDSTFNHIFSILHLSAGFEKRLGKHMNWQIEPYAKIPLGGVGFGNIRLSSFGVNFSVQYRHPVKR